MIVGVVSFAVLATSVIQSPVEAQFNNFFSSQLRTQCQVTSSATEGPYYIGGAPFKNQTLCTATPVHDRVIISGRVMDADCNTGIPAELDVWSADNNGVYSNGFGGYECRAVIETDQQGYYRFVTVLPGRYLFGRGFRPAHIHFKVRPLAGMIMSPTGPRVTGPHKELTTQLYFQNDAFLGTSDSCIAEVCKSNEPSLVTSLAMTNDIKTYTGTWNIVLQRS